MKTFDLEALYGSAALPETRAEAAKDFNALVNELGWLQESDREDFLPFILSYSRRRNTTVDGQNFNLTDVEILELARETAEIEHVDALKMFLDTHYDGDRELDFDLDEGRAKREAAQ